MIRFADPLFLLLLGLLVPLFVYHKSSGGRIRFSSLGLLKEIKVVHFNPRTLLLVLRALAIIFIVLALARPQAGKKFSEVNSDGVDMILALDTSGSMQAMDFVVNGERVRRLDVIKKVVTDFIQKRPNDRMGLVVFGTEAFTQCPLTLDHGILVDFLKRLEIGMAGDATAIGSAIGTGVKRIKDLKAKSKIIILLTDGKSNSGRIEPIKAAELAQSMGVKIYTIGVGTNGPVPIQQNGFWGKQFVYTEVEFDEDTLIEIARITDGKYFRATDTQELEKIYGEIDRLEKTEVKVKEYTEYLELFHYFLLLGMLFLLAEIILANSKLRKIP